MGANGGALTLDKMDELIDLIKPGTPDALLHGEAYPPQALSPCAAHRATCSKPMSMCSGGGRSSTTACRSWSMTSFQPMRCRVLRAQSAPASTPSSSGGRASIGLENGGIQVERVGELETKDATRTRVKWYRAWPCSGRSAWRGCRESTRRRRTRGRRVGSRRSGAFPAPFPKGPQHAPSTPPDDTHQLARWAGYRADEPLSGVSGFLRRSAVDGSATRWRNTTDLQLRANAHPQVSLVPLSRAR